MKRFLIAAALAVTTFSTSTFAVDISINIGQPDYYGRIDTNGYPQPQILYTEPVIIAPISTNQTPIYMRVPPGHAKDWGKHCGKYNACGERVLFVQDDWYNHEYAPRYRELHPNDNQGQERNKRDNHDDDRNKRDNHDDYDRNKRDNRDYDDNRANKKVYKAKHYKGNKGNRGKGKGNKGHKGNRGNGNGGKHGKGRGH